MSQLAKLGFGDADLTPRLKFVNLLPSAVMILTVASLLLSGAPGAPPRPDVLLGNLQKYGIPGALAASAMILTLALLLQPLELASIRVLEGYWRTTGVAGRARDLMLWLQQRRKKRLEFIVANADDLEDDERVARLVEAADDALDALPRSDLSLMPTALGNRLRLDEELAGEPYGLSAVLVWPRLHYVLPKNTLQMVTEYRNQLDIAARLCLAFALTGAISFGLLARHGWWLALPFALLVLSWFSYRSAINAATVYGIAFTAAIDVHRLRLLQEMRVDLPPDLRVEKEINKHLSDIWRRTSDEHTNVTYTRTDKDYRLRHHFDGEDSLTSSPDSRNSPDTSTTG